MPPAYAEWIRQRRHLLPRGVGELLPSVTDVDVPQPRQPVDVLAPGRVGDERALPRHPDPRPGIGGRVMERMHQVGAIDVERSRRVHPDMLLRFSRPGAAERME